ncbi:putative nucleic acid-binding protein [Tamaricihabitans halophyticus]|uniref:Ribonuclease VapC n=1 Tax=Tamaricihabitans halophyticus TaxID=1262583 RepID=A0A4R2QW84_9PSEU|nr:type II toxin-antitoxin system VapC family toxin [Tamaricihabitans halophyticus]TCP53967.1 putative nucleic acid-binding protein [Tamaricihabitans halophyticus]
MIVVDASAAIDALLNAGHARQALSTQQAHLPHLIDSEIASGLRRQVTAGRVAPEAARDCLRVWQKLGVTRHPTFPLLARVWELRENISAYDASYVALAEFLACPLLTADARLTRAPGTRCTITLVPST